ncbi:MAG TPA: hypothetical protein VH592_15030 [Gemmataceae bacterium]|jgi:hypothetical protein
MGMGPIIWACLALTLHQSSPPTWYMNTRNVGLPLRLKEQGASDIQQLILLHSADQGGTWEQGESKRPGDPQPFKFHAPKDGVYWFILQQVDRENKATPRDPNRKQPMMIVIVDTAPPQVKVTAERLPSGQIRARWSAADAYADPRSLRLDFHTSALPEGEWTPLGTAMVLQGEKEFDPGKHGKMGEVRVRIQLKDQAGNVGEDVCVLTSSAAAPAPNISAPYLSEAKVAPTEGSPIGLIPSAPRNDSPSQPSQLTSRQTQHPVIERLPGSLSTPSAVVEPSAPAPGPAPLTGLPIASNTDPMPPAPSNLAETQPNHSGVQIVKAREVRIDFTVGKVGPSGLGNADIYVTLDKGQTWKKMPGDVPISLPQVSDIHAQEVTGSVGVQLPAEGTIYGFIVAVKSKAGLAPPPPRQGDPPQALVELDSTVPQGQLFKPQLDPSQPNTLILGWEAKDRNLGPRPITLEWSEQKDGPWNLIGEQSLPNAGQYPWHLPDRLPPRVYLRLTMRDQAGNVSIAKTDKPELIDLSVPQTRITGVAPAAR